MTWVGVAIGGASIIGSVISGNATKAAAQAQADASNSANQMQWNMYQQTRSDNQPMMDARNSALGMLQGDNGVGKFNYNQFSDPSTQFRLQAGQDAINRASAGRGGVMSGSNLMALQNYGQQGASQEYGNAFNRYQSNIGNMMSLAGLGQNAGAQTTGAGMNAASNMGANTMNAANGQAAAGIANANNWSGALNNMANQWQNYQMMNRMYPQSSGSFTDPNAGSYSSFGNPYGYGK